MNFNTYFPADLCLQTEMISMRPMQMEDAAHFDSLTKSVILWKYFSKELNDPLQLKQWMQEAISERAACRRVPFTIVLKEKDLVCGSTSFGNISLYDKRIEIGWSWLGEQFQGTGVNRHCKFALLRYAFEVLDFERVEFKTDNLNERSKQALRKIGATPEGVLRSHMLMPHGRRRDSIYFSVLRTEWPEVKQNFFPNIH